MSAAIAKHCLISVGRILAGDGGADKLRARLKAMRAHLSDASTELNFNATGEKEALQLIFKTDEAMRDLETALFQLEFNVGTAHSILEKICQQH